MRRTYDPFRLLLISVAGWLGQQRGDAIDYLREENRLKQPAKAGKDKDSVPEQKLDELQPQELPDGPILNDLLADMDITGAGVFEEPNETQVPSAEPGKF